MAEGLTEAELNKLEEIILGKVQQRTPSRMNEDTYIAKAFRHHDLGNTGWCDFEAFKRSITPFTSGIGDHDLYCMYRRYAPDGDMYYRSFATEFVNGSRRQDNQTSMPEPEYNETPDEILMRIKSWIYSQGPRAIIALATAFRNADPQNLRSLSYDNFHRVMGDFFASTPCEMSEDQVDQIFMIFRQPYAPDPQIAYDEFFLALKEDPSPDCRTCIRAAFRRLDKHSEGLVDMSQAIRAFNASRHPQVAEGSRSADDVREEFVDTLKDLVAFRRGQRSYPTNLVAWEEFEDYYKFVSGCFDSDETFCTVLERVWDLDKVENKAIEARAALAAPAAGLPPKSRAGLHHWQSNTLPVNTTYQNMETAVNLGQVLLRVRRSISERGLRAAVETCKIFFAADDDVDDVLDVYEFRKACQQARLKFNDAEEACVFEACAGPVSSGHFYEKVSVPRFLELLHGQLSQSRRALIEQAWVQLGGTPNDEDSVIPPSKLRDEFASEAHPEVREKGIAPAQIESEFLDTFSLLAYVRNGCRDNMVAWSDFLAYYQVVSSTIENDGYFALVMHNLWSLPHQDGRSRTYGGESPREGARSFHHVPKGPSPMAGRKPPAFDGPSAYAVTDDYGEDFRESHPRFMRKDGPEPVGSEFGGMGASFSPITKSSIVFNEVDSSELSTVASAIRENLAKRDMKGWKMFVERFEQYDYKKNGGIMRLDFQRLNKTLGVGLSPEEQQLTYKLLSANRRDGSMDYKTLVRVIKGSLPERRRAYCERLYDALRDASGMVSTEAIKSAYNARSTPACILGRKTAPQAMSEFYGAVDFFGPRGYDHDSFLDFCLMMSATLEDDHEFRVMLTDGFGLPMDQPN